MIKEFDELKDIITELLQVHSQLIITAKEMNIALKSEDLFNVHKFSIRFDKQITVIEKLETKRLDICDRISLQKNWPTRHINLDSVITFMPVDIRKDFWEIKNSLKNKINELSGINTSNKILINEALASIEKNFEIISQHSNTPAGYERNGNSDVRPVRKSLVNHLI